jgi:hypothetical protein
MRISALSPSAMIQTTNATRRSCPLTVSDGEEVVEENTSKAYVATTGLVSPMAPVNGAGSALFVINLCASIAPVQTTSKNLPGLDNYRLYQVSRVEDGRTRHRLRLGFFTSESHAESVLTVVRQQYPTAFTASLCEEDRKFARGYLPEAANASPAPTPKRPVAVVVSSPAPITQPKPSAQPARVAAAPIPQAKATAPTSAPIATPTKAAAPAPAVPKAKPIATAAASNTAPKPAAAKTLSRAEPAVIELTWEPEPTAKAQATNAAPTPQQSAPSSNALLGELTWEPPSLPPASTGAGNSTSDTAKHPVLAPGFKTQPVVKAQPSAAAAPPPVAQSKAKADAATSMRVPALQLTLSDPPAVQPEHKSTSPAAPFHVGKGVEFGDIGISLQAEPIAAKAAVTPASKPAQRAAPVAKAPAPTPAKPAAIVAKPAAAKPVQPTRPALLDLPELDSTQTIRALTSAELNDDAQEKWFAIQLAVSEQPVNLDAMPHLDIFEAYRLYSVASAGSGKIVHSLRLGFFKEAVSAEAVSGYLKTFFGSPSVLRISVAEQARFKDAPAPKAPMAEAKQAKVVEISNARAARPVIPTVTMEVVPSPMIDPSASGTFKPNATGSFKPNATGSFQASASGTHKALKSAGPATKKGGTLAQGRTGSTGKYKVPQKSLSQQLMEEAREVELSESAIRKLPKNSSLLSRLVGKLTK